MTVMHVDVCLTHLGPSTCVGTRTSMDSIVLCLRFYAPLTPFNDFNNAPHEVVHCPSRPTEPVYPAYAVVAAHDFSPHIPGSPCHH